MEVNFFLNLNKKNILRVLHFMVVVVYVVCIGMLYYYAVEDVFDNKLYVISFVLFGEAVALILNEGRCPLEHVHKKVGDDKGFFEHFLPVSIVPYVIPFFAFVTAIGFLLLYL